MKMEVLSGTHCLAEFMAVRHGMLLVDIKAASEMDKVDLFDTQMKAKAAEGELATAQLAAMADGVIDHHESKTLSALFRKKLNHQVHGFLASSHSSVQVQLITLWTCSYQAGERLMLPECSSKRRTFEVIRDLSGARKMNAPGCSLGRSVRVNQRVWRLIA